jgi:hypothetical protein
MNREFFVSAWNRAFYLILAAVVSCAGIYLFTVPQQHAAVYIFPLLMVATGGLITLSILKGRIIITNNSIIRVNFLKTKEILFTNIKGFRIEDKVIRFETVLPGNKFSIARYSDFGEISEFKKWLNENFVNLDLVEYNEGLNEILNNSELGLSEDERKGKLKRARNIAFAYNLGGIILFVVGLIFREETGTTLAILVMLVYPALSILVIFKSNGLIRFYSKKASPYYHIFIGLYTSVIFLLVFSALNYEVLAYNNIWLSAIPAFIFGSIIKFANKDKSGAEEKGSWILLIIISVFYGYSCLIQTNCLFDGSKEVIYHTKVIDHYINHNKGTHPYIRLDTWGPQTQTKEIQVSMNFYERSPIGSSITIHLKKGLLHIPWYSISL